MSPRIQVNIFVYYPKYNVSANIVVEQGPTYTTFIDILLYITFTGLQYSNRVFDRSKKKKNSSLITDVYSFISRRGSPQYCYEIHYNIVSTGKFDGAVLIII